MERTKEPDLALLIELLAESRVAYAVIGGVALQIHQREPRTTLDIDIALERRSDLPIERLTASGFRRTGSFEHSDNWVGPQGTPIQFTDDPALTDAVERAVDLSIGEHGLRVLRVDDLLHEKLRAGSDPARRRSKRIQDLADAQALIEEHPELEPSLSASERALLDQLPR